MIYQPAIETMPVAQLRALQSERFVRLVRYMYEQQPFYRRQWDAHGIDIRSVKSIDDIVRFPFTIKHIQHLRDEYPFGLMAVPPADLVRIHASSGTTGKPTVVGYTRADIDMFAEVVARSLCCAGALPGMKLHNAYGYGLFTGGLGLHYGGERLGMAVIPVSGGMTDRQLMLLQDFGPEVISCTPSYALTLAEAIRERGIPLEKFKLRYAILGAEPWTETTRQAVEAGLGVTATNIYGLSEIVGPGVSQEDFEEKGGSHIWEDHFFPEVVHPDTGEPQPYGTEGILVFTTLTKQGIPLMRYRTNDICSLYYDSDSKRTHVKMSPIKGRSDDMLIIRGVNLFHTQVEAVLHDMPEFSANYQLIIYREGALDAVEVLVELSEDVYAAKGARLPVNDEFLNELKRRLEKKIKDNIGLSMRITLADRDALPRSEGGKLKRILDRRG
ncbi:MAG TPA: phenylacetate--CoA ligase [Saprospiraceae bacterium]|nr:phenylacetate--CoA ligase [Saprospiraceae bacterium]